MLAHLIRIGLGLFFLVAAVLKLADLRAFARLVGDFGIVPDALVETAAVVLLVLEGTAGILLVARMRGGFGLAAALLALFLGVLAYGIALGLDVDCGCLGIGPGTADGTDLSTALARDVLLLGLVALARWLERRACPRAVDPGPGGERESRA